MLSNEPPAGKSILEHAFNTEVQESKAIISAALTVINTTLEKFILSSLSATRRMSEGKYISVYHFDGKAATVDTIKAEYPDLANKTLVLQLGRFANNWRGPTPIRPTKPDGSFEIAACGSPDALHPTIDPERDTATFVRALAALPPQGEMREPLGFGDMMSFRTWAELWGKRNTVPAHYKELTVKEYNDRISWLPGLGRELGEMYAYSAKFGYDGRQALPITDLKLDRPITTMCKYLKNEDFSPLFGSDSNMVTRL